MFTRTQFRTCCHCERSAAISWSYGTLLRERDRHIASLLAMTNWVRVSIVGRLHGINRAVIGSSQKGNRVVTAPQRTRKTRCIC